MPDYTKTYGSLVIQPIDLINAFKLDFCFASVIKWLTKWHMERKNEDILKAKYYSRLCYGIEPSNPLKFALRMYCQLNGFLSVGATSCLLMDVTSDIMEGNIERANALLNNAQ